MIQKDENYSNAMIEAFIDKPSETLWYQNSFSKYNINGVDAMKWNWSWWAFGMGFLFFLYRKQYLAAIGVFVASITIGFIPFVGSFLVMILTGVYGTYFIYKDYTKKLAEIEAVVGDEDKRIETMRFVGGYNQWVVWVYIAIMSIVFLGIISAILIPSSIQ